MQLIILETSDTHGFILPTDYQARDQAPQPFGLARVKTYFEQVIAKYGRENVLIIDNGDFLQGSALTAYTHRQGTQEAYQALAQAYNLLDYDYGVLGNHDFNFGLDVLKTNLQLAQRKFLAANVLDETTGDSLVGAKYDLIEKAGVTVGVIGLTTQYIPHWEDPRHIPHLVFQDVVAVLEKLVPEVRAQADVVVVSYHGGFERDLTTGAPTERETGENLGSKILATIPGIDVLLTGHQHRKLAFTQGQTLVVQPGFQAELVGQVDLELRRNEQNQVELTSGAAKIVSMATVEPSAEVLERLASYNEQVEDFLDQPIGHLEHDYTYPDATQARIMGTPSLNLVHQVQLANSGADISAAAIVKENVHGFGKVVTMRELMLNYPYTSELVTVELTGAQLREILEYTASFLQKDHETGAISFVEKFLQPKYQLYHFDLFYPLEYEFDLSKPLQQRVTKLEFKHQPVVADQKLTLVVNKFRALGGGKYPVYPDLAIKQEFSQELVEMLQEYFKQHEVVQVDERQNYLFK